jgi:hypothetical protein
MERRDCQVVVLIFGEDMPYVWGRGVVRVRWMQGARRQSRVGCAGGRSEAQGMDVVARGRGDRSRHNQGYTLAHQNDVYTLVFFRYERCPNQINRKLIVENSLTIANDVPFELTIEFLQIPLGYSYLSTK